MNGEVGIVIDDEVKAVVLAIVIVAGVFAIAQLISSGRVVEPFSALGLLGPRMKIGDYPKNVLVNQSINLYLFVDNHEGRVMYYVIYAKLGNRSTVINENVSANAPILDTYEVILPHGENMTIPVSLRITKPQKNARLIFEMWVYDPERDEVRYHGRWVQLWLNVTAPQMP
ncbi:MAG: hypothetical protein DRJ43_07305 [Thermoprotei archaeon]|nr:MAG: hypothetical protein DRJ43_07305 [Thermoprotei archaeon]